MQQGNIRGMGAWSARLGREVQLVVNLGGQVTSKIVCTRLAAVPNSPADIDPSSLFANLFGGMGGGMGYGGRPTFTFSTSAGPGEHFWRF